MPDGHRSVTQRCCPFAHNVDGPLDSRLVPPAWTGRPDIDRTTPNPVRIDRISPAAVSSGATSYRWEPPRVALISTMSGITAQKWLNINGRFLERFST
jgi:hypothetical protein